MTVRTVELPTAKRKREMEKEKGEVMQSMPSRNPRHSKEPVAVSQEKRDNEKESDLSVEPKKPRTWGDHSVAINVMRGLVVRPSEQEKVVKPVSLCSKVNYVQPPPRVCVVGVTGSSSGSSGRGNQSQHNSSTAHTRASTVGVEVTYDSEDATLVRSSPSRRAADGRRGSDSGGRNTSSSRGNGKSYNRDKKKKEVPMPSRRSSR